ncbi:MAG: DUF1801 domain-containing protein [Bacteroidota bacterium]
MRSEATTAIEYLSSLPEERIEPMDKLYQAIKKNLPKGFEEGMGYGMLGWSVPHSTYPAGYHCDPAQPLPFLGMASQKNFIAVYHMGVYSDSELLKWFTDEYPKHCKRKLDMGKSCIRFKHMDDIPYKLIGELASKMTPKQWIAMYEKALKK